MSAPRTASGIDYRQAPPGAIRALFRRIVPLGAVLAALAMLGGWALVRVPEVLAWRRAMRFTEPPERVVFDNDPSEAARLIGTGHFMEVSANYKDSPGLNGAIRFFSLGGGFDYNDALFLHARRAQGRRELHLVQVAGAGAIERSPSGCVISIAGICFPPEGVPVPKGALSPRPQTVFIPPGGRLRIFAGQPDPADDAHLTIRYEVNGMPGLIEGWLRDDSYGGVQLKITPPAPPARRR